MKKTYVLDTNVLIHDPEAVFHFEDNDIVLPITVIEELDHLKKGSGEIPYSARHALRLIDAFRESGRLSAGVALPGGGTLRVVFDKEPMLPLANNDDRIISTALSLGRTEDSRRPVILVSKDTSVRIKADTYDLTTQDYLTDKTTVFMKYGAVGQGDQDPAEIRSVRYLMSGAKVFRVYGENNMQLIRRQRSVMSIMPKNIEQECAIDALLADNVDIVALTGRAGTGKTLLAIAAGLYLCTKTVHKVPADHMKKFDQVMVARPIVPMGQDIEYLPGDL